MTHYLDKIASVTPLARQVICEQATEAPYSGAYNTVEGLGTYLCRRCGLALFRASSQFSSGCGWPSFDDSIADAVTESLDNDGQRTEIHCTRCTAHLGHVFLGEQFTTKNRRHCVNALALDFVLDTNVLDTEEAIVAGGCFWGVDYYLKTLPGVLSVEVGYTGGKTPYPSYQEVCSGQSGHYEAVRVLFDVARISYPQILSFFFEIHDPTQADGQGPDLGLQYQSAVFYYNQAQYDDAKGLISLLKEHGYAPATQVFPATLFWKAEEEHQQYYNKHSAVPYCHRRVHRFSSE